MKEPISIRPFEVTDWAATWHIIEPVFRSGDTYAYSPSISEEEAYRVWIESPSTTFVAVNERAELVGTYFIKPNQPALGDHVCNCGYVVAGHARRQGIASSMCEHSQAVALAQGYHAMQYNLVVSTNEVAVRLWKRHGFERVGTLPDAFRHPRFGFVDAFIMYKLLNAESVHLAFAGTS